MNFNATGSYTGYTSSITPIMPYRNPVAAPFSSPTQVAFVSRKQTKSVHHASRSIQVQIPGSNLFHRFWKSFTGAMDWLQFPGAYAQPLPTLDDLDAAIVNQPDNPLLYTIRADAWSKKGNLENALQDAQRAAKIAPYDYQAAINLIDLYLATGKNEKAVVEASRAIALNPVQNHQAYYLRAVAELRMMRLEVAQSDLHMAYKIQPETYQNSGDYHYFHGSTLIKPDQMNEAIEEFQNAIALGIDDPTIFLEAHTSLIALLTRKKRFDEARALIKKCDANSSLAETYDSMFFFLRGFHTLLETPTDFARAQEDFEIAHSRGENVPLWCSSYFLEIDQPDTAISYFKQRYALRKVLHSAYPLSLFSLYKGNWKEGLHYFEKLLSSLNEKVISAILRYLQDSPTSYEEYFRKRADEITATIPAHQFLKASLYLFAGNHTKASLIMNQAASQHRLYTLFPKLVHHLTTGTSEEASSCLRDFLKEYLGPAAASEPDQIALMSVAYMAILLLNQFGANPQASLVMQRALEATKNITHIEPETSCAGMGKFALFGTFAVALIAVIIKCKSAPPLTPKPKPTTRGIESHKKPRKPSRSPPSLPKVEWKEIAINRDDSVQKAAFFDSTIKRLFPTSSPFEVRLTTQDGANCKALIDCSSGEFWNSLPLYQQRYSEDLASIFGPVQIRIVGSEKRWAVVAETNKLEMVSEEAIKRVEKNLLSLNKEVALYAKTKIVQQESDEAHANRQAAFEIRSREQWENRLQTLFSPLAKVSVDLDEQKMLQVQLLIRQNLQERFLPDEGIKKAVAALQSLTKHPIDLVFDYASNTLHFSHPIDNPPEGVIDPLELQEVLLSEESESEEENVSSVELAPPLGTLEAIPASKKSMSPSKIWKTVKTSEATDRQRLEELKEVIKLLELASHESSMLYIKKHLLVRFLQVYKNLSFLLLRPGEIEEAIKIRNLLVHHLFSIKDHELGELVAKIFEKKHYFFDSYAINDALIARYCLNLQTTDYANLLLYEIERRDVTQDSDEEQETLSKMITFCELFFQSPAEELTYAHKSGVILALRVLFQAESMSLATKLAIEEQLKKSLGTTWVYPIFEPGKGTVQKNLLTDLGDRMAHGDVNMNVLPFEMQLVEKGLETFKKVAYEYSFS